MDLIEWAHAENNFATSSDGDSFVGAASEAAARGDIPMLQYCINLRPIVGPSWRLIMENALQGGHIPVLECLISQGVDVMALSNLRSWPFSVARHGLPMLEFGRRCGLKLV